jgi:hypothetical protein
MFSRIFSRHKHRDVRSFESDVDAVGGVRGSIDRGFKEVPLDKVVGSVGRSHNLRSDFFYKTGEAITKRFTRVGEAMEAGKSLPPLELYKVKGKDSDGTPAESKYYVVDGHHRVAMGKQMGFSALDAHVVEYRVDGKVDGEPPAKPNESKA